MSPSSPIVVELRERLARFERGLLLTATPIFALVVVLGWSTKSLLGVPFQTALPVFWTCPMILNVGYVVVVSLKHGVAVSRTFAIDRGKRPAAFIIAVAGLVLVGITMIAASTLLIRLSLQNEPVV